MKLADFPDVSDLPLREKLKLVDELWLSMTSELDSLEVSQREKELLDERWAAFLKDPGKNLELRIWNLELHKLLVSKIIPT